MLRIVNRKMQAKFFNVMQVISQASCAPSTRVLGPSGAEYIAPSANDLVEVNAPDLAPAEGASPDQVQGEQMYDWQLASVASIKTN